MSTVTTERTFSAMKVVNKMEDGFFANNLIIYIGNEILKNFSSDLILDNFVSLRSGCNFRHFVFYIFLEFFFFVLVPTCELIYQFNIYL
jgi:hypothetical protein